MALIKSKFVGNMVTYTETPTTETQNPNITTHEKFFPIDLFTASFGSCLTLYASVIAKKNDFEIASIRSEINREMDGPKVSKFDTLVYLEGSYSDQQKEIIENAVKNCPVANSLSESINKQYTFIY